jgi:hypothetical protein
LLAHRSIVNRRTNLYHRAAEQRIGDRKLRFYFFLGQTFQRGGQGLLFLAAELVRRGHLGFGDSQARVDFGVVCLQQMRQKLHTVMIDQHKKKIAGGLAQLHALSQFAQ